MNIKIYDKSNIDQMPWQDSKDGIFSQAYLTPIVKNGTLNYIDNTDTEMQILSFEDNFFPITISKENTSVKNSYVCSPNSHYIYYILRNKYKRLGFV